MNIGLPGMEQKSPFIVVKLGSSTLTQAGHPHHALIDRLCGDLHELRERGMYPVVVTSGAVQLGQHDTAINESADADRAGKAAVGQIRLVAAFSEHLMRRGYRAAQILLKREDFVCGTTGAAIAAAIRAIVVSGGVALVNENDVTSAGSGFTSNDELSAALAGVLGAPKLILLTDRPGVYDADPRTHRDAQLFDVVAASDERLLAAASETPTRTGTGGMKSKIRAARTAAAHGAVTVVACYDEAGKLVRIVQGERLGTWIVPDARIDDPSRIQPDLLEEEPSA